MINPPRPAVDAQELEPQPLAQRPRVQPKFDASTINAEAEQAEVECVRERVCKPTEARIPPWRLEDVKEEDIDMTSMPDVSAIHYGLSPGEVLEGSDNNDDDDDDDSAVDTRRFQPAAPDNDDVNLNETLVL